MIREAKVCGLVFAGKVYPKGVTTNSHNGVSDFEKLIPVFKEMEKVGMVLSIHGQKPESFILHRECNFLPTLGMIVRACPNLRIVLEHISTKEAVRAVLQYSENVAATITPHHLLYTLHDILCWVEKDGEKQREGLNPHHYCQPVLQHPDDRLELVMAATSGNPKFFLGSDSAPHSKEKKESGCGCAGVFNAPVIMPVLAKLFSNHTFPSGTGMATRVALENFTSTFGAQFYNLPLNKGEITLVRKPWKVAHSYHCVVPLCAGEELEWQVEP